MIFNKIALKYLLFNDDMLIVTVDSIIKYEEEYIMSDYDSYSDFKADQKKTQDTLYTQSLQKLSKIEGAQESMSTYSINGSGKMTSTPLKK